MNSTLNVQVFNYLFILEFGTAMGVIPQEIIEISCLKLSTQSQQVEESFRQYVRPRINRKLLNETTMYTGITQLMVNSAPFFSEAWEKFMKWYKSNKGNETAAFVTIDNWDLKEQLRCQSLLSKVNITEDFRQWINLKKVYYKAYNFFPRTIEFMVTELGLPFQGNLGNSYDDVTNAALVVQKMLRENIIFKFNNEEITKLGPWPSKRPDWEPYVPPKTIPPRNA